MSRIAGKYIDQMGAIDESVLSWNDSASQWQPAILSITEPPVAVNCVITRTTDQSIPNNTNTNVTFPTEIADTDGFHSTVSNTDRITIPSGLGGYYICTANLEYNGSTTGYRFMAITLNSGEPDQTGAIRSQTLDTTDWWRGDITAYLRLVEGDYICLRTKHKAGTSLDVRKAAFSVVRIRL